MLRALILNAFFALAAVHVVLRTNHSNTLAFNKGVFWRAAYRDTFSVLKLGAFGAGLDDTFILCGVEDVSFLTFLDAVVSIFLVAIWAFFEVAFLAYNLVTFRTGCSCALLFISKCETFRAAYSLTFFSSSRKLEVGITFFFEAFFILESVAFWAFVFNAFFIYQLVGFWAANEFAESVGSSFLVLCTQSAPTVSIDKMVSFGALGPLASSILGIDLKAIKTVFLHTFSIDILETIFTNNLVAFTVFEDIRIIALSLHTLKTIFIKFCVFRAGVKYTFIVFFFVAFWAVLDAKISLFSEASSTVKLPKTFTFRVFCKSRGAGDNLALTVFEFFVHHTSVSNTVLSFFTVALRTIFKDALLSNLLVSLLTVLSDTCSINQRESLFAWSN